MAAGPSAAYLGPADAAESRMVVANETIVRRTCPSVECGGVGRFNVGESVVTYETQAGWTRVSPYYTAGCHDGQAAFVQFGPAYCTRQNGIEQGEFAEWVKAEFLKVEQPAEMAAPNDDCSIGACVKPGILRAGRGD